MTDQDSSKEQLIQELRQLVDRRTADLEQANAALRKEIAEHRRAREELQRSEERFRELAKTYGVIEWTAAPDGSEMLYINPEAEQVYGRACEEFYENPNVWLETIHSEDQQNEYIIILKKY